MKKDIPIDTLTSRDVESLALADKRRKEKRIAVSLYLGVKADRDFREVANSLFSEERKRLDKRDDFTKDERDRIDVVFSAIERRLRTMRLPDKTRAFVIFCDDSNARHFYKVPVYIPSRLVVERSWYVHPFVKSLAQYPHYAVVFLERDRARIFNYLWGEVEDESEEILSEVPQRMNTARTANRGVEEKKVRNHIEVHVNRHLKKVAAATEAYMDENEIPFLVIASRKELIARFETFLSGAVRKKIAGSYLTRTDQDMQKIKARSLEVIDGFEYEREEGIIRRLVGGSSKKERSAVLGMEDVLRELENFRILVLAIGKRYTPRGYLCADDQRLYPEEDTNLVCVSPLAAQSDLADEIIEAAIAQGVEIVHFVHEHADFDRHGVGAILR